MTRKDFQLIASALNQGIEEAMGGMDEDVEFMERQCIYMADALSETNERFDRRRFLRACGVEGK